MSEPVVDNNTRGAILEALAARSKTKEAPAKTSSSGDVDEKTSFGELLERSLEKRAEMKEDNTVSDEERKKVISESQVDIVGDIMKRLL